VVTGKGRGPPSQNRLQRLHRRLLDRSHQSAATEFLGPVPELVLEDQVVAAGHGLEQLGAHGRFGGEAGRAAQDGKGVANAGSGVRLEQVTFSQCRSAWAVVQQVTAGAGMPTNSGIARSMYC
jgi:hypothetical protein